MSMSTRPSLCCVACVTFRDVVWVLLQMKSDREAKLELLKHFGWDHGLPAGKSAVFKEDKAIQSLTTQVRLPYASCFHSRTHSVSD
jgi:hypothetical protein